MGSLRPQRKRWQGSLTRTLAYRNDQIVHKFLERYEMPFEEAQDLFEEMKKWLWLCARASDRGAAVAVTQEMFLLDEMWHTFILFTKEYDDFCHDRLGGFVHHAPMTKEAKERRAHELDDDRAGVLDRERQGLREQLALIADELGADTLFKWFVDYPRRYGPEFMARAVRTPTPSLPSMLTEQLQRIADRYHPESEPA